MFCGAGVLPASALNDSASGVTDNRPGGGGGGGAAVKVIETGTVALPADPASKTRCDVRAPALAWPLRSTVNAALAPAASWPEVIETVKAASSDETAHDSVCPPSLSSEIDCAGGAAGACVEGKVNAGGATCRQPIAG